MNCLAGLPDEKLSVTFGLIVNNLSLSVERVIDGFLDLSQKKNDRRTKRGTLVT